MTTFPVPATVVIGVMVGLIIVANILSRNSSRPSGLRGWLLAILAVGGMVAVFVYGPRLWQPLPSSSTPAHAAAVAAPGQLRSAPSLSADFIDQVLAVNPSPAQGLGTTLY
jgi:multisubunit Na+/H+ antiporter MnhB subunit